MIKTFFVCLKCKGQLCSDIKNSQLLSTFQLQNLETMKSQSKERLRREFYLKSYWCTTLFYIHWSSEEESCSLPLVSIDWLNEFFKVQAPVNSNPFMGFCLPLMTPILCKLRRVPWGCINMLQPLTSEIGWSMNQPLPPPPYHQNPPGAWATFQFLIN